jgi:archaemetzincin
MEPIFVWWIGEEEADRELMEHVRLHLARAFGRPALPWRGGERPRHAFDLRRKQHASGAILRWLLEKGPPTGKVLGVTDRDLFIPILTYVFGEAQLGGRAAVVSLARLAEDVELLGPRLLVERLAKEAVHEVGHAYGLVHCGTERCVMARSPAVREVDEKTSELCEECRARVQELDGGLSDVER